MKLWVLGNGQLGMLMRHAGMPLALDVIPVGIEDIGAQQLAADDLVTAEREHWPSNSTTDSLAAHPNFANLKTIQDLADRKLQKSQLDALHLATAPWQALEDDTDIDALFEKLGERVLLKQRRGGYDGKGQLWLKQGEPLPDLSDWRGSAIAEKGIEFSEELSIIGARNAQGEKVFYPLVRNLHQNGILLASQSPVPEREHLQPQAEQMLSALMDAVDYHGVMTMECFRVGDTLLINEIATRVHNSGHWTMTGANISQFELHLRAVTGLPLTRPVVLSPTVMINLLGVERNNQWLTVPGSHLTWYNKDVRPGRKLGHVNLVSDTPAHLRDTTAQLLKLLPDNYQAVLDWFVDH